MSLCTICFIDPHCFLLFISTSPILITLCERCIREPDKNIRGVASITANTTAGEEDEDEDEEHEIVMFHHNKGAPSHSSSIVTNPLYAAAGKRSGGNNGLKAGFSVLKGTADNEESTTASESGSAPTPMRVRLRKVSYMKTRSVRLL